MLFVLEAACSVSRAMELAATCNDWREQRACLRQQILKTKFIFYQYKLHSILYSCLPLFKSILSTWIVTWEASATNLGICRPSDTHISFDLGLLRPLQAEWGTDNSISLQYL